MRAKMKTGLLFYILSIVILYAEIGFLIANLSVFLHLPRWSLLSVGIELLGIIIMAVFVDGCYVDGGLSKENNFRSMAGLVSICFSFFTDTCIMVTEGINEPLPLIINFTANSLYFLNNLTLIYCFAQYILSVSELKTKATDIYLKIIRIYYFVLTGLLLLNIPFRIVFDLDAQKKYQGGPALPYITLFTCIMVICMFVSVAESSIELVEKRAMLLYIGLPMIFGVVQEFIPAFSFQLCSLLISACLVYVQSYIRQGRILQKERIELQNQQTATMLSQIQPHFLYNSLNAIVALCDIDPQLAKQTTIDFSTYLEHNLAAVTESEPIPFSKELEHVEAYLRIEKTRFQDLLQVEYNIEEQDFKVPALTVQPLVENAVKHGLHHKQGGGTVCVETHKTEEGWYIIVRDDGVGFDVEHPEIINHGVGIVNIRHRLKVQCNGVLSFESEIGYGTTAIVFIPNRRN